MKKKLTAIVRWILVISLLMGVAMPSVVLAEWPETDYYPPRMEDLPIVEYPAEPSTPEESEISDYEAGCYAGQDEEGVLEEAGGDDEYASEETGEEVEAIIEAVAMEATGLLTITFNAMRAPNSTPLDELNASGGFWRTDPGLTGAGRNADFRIVERLMTNNYGVLPGLPANPVHATTGYTFAGWVLASGAPVTPETVFMEDTAVYASWARTWSGFESLRFNAAAPPSFVSGGGLEINTFFVQSYVANPFVGGAAGPFNNAGGNLGVHGMSIRVPVSYNGEAFSAEHLRDAPILVLNPWGGDSGTSHAAAQGGVPAANSLAGDALRQGWIVVHHGMRGHTIAEAGVADTENFHNFGKVPHPVVDSKAAVRYLHWNINEGHLPWGDAERIFVQGHSSGGCAVSMLGASGNTTVFERQMELIGALPLSMAGVYDHIFGAVPVNPVQIRNWGEPAHAWEVYQNYMHLTHAPGSYIHPLNAIMANEWVRIMNEYLSGMTAVEASPLVPAGTLLTPENYTQYLLGFMRESIIRELNIISESGPIGRPNVPSAAVRPDLVPLRGRAAVEAYLTLEKPADGTYSTRPMPFSFLNPVFCTENPDVVVDVNNSWTEFMRHIWGACANCQTGPGASPCERAGIPGAPWCQVNPLQLMQFRFDRPMTAQTIQENGIVRSAHTNDGYGDDLSLAVNQRPGNLNRPVNTASARSFGIPNDFIAIYSDIGWYWIGNHRSAHSGGALPNITVSEPMRELLIFQRNSVDPMYFILNADSLNVDIAPYWHIRNGARDISPGRATILAQVTALENSGYSVNFEFTWNIGHSVAALTNDLPEFWAWANDAVDPQETVPPSEVAVGPQVGTLAAGTTGYVTFTVTAAGLPGEAGVVDFAQTGVVSNLPAGVSASGTIAVNEQGSGSGILTLTGSAAAVQGVTANLTVTLRDTVSEAFTLTIVQAPAQDPPVQPTVPQAPQNLVATPGDGRLDVSWEAPISDGGAAVTSYQISISAGVWIPVPSGRAHSFIGLTNGNEHTIRVRAVNSVGHGDVATVTATPVAPPAQQPPAQQPPAWTPPPTQPQPQPQPPAPVDRVALAVANTNAASEGTSVVVENVTQAIAATPSADHEEGLAFVTIALPAGAAAQATVMAILNDDLTFTAIPTRFNADGSATVVIGERVYLVALNVESGFIDIYPLVVHVQDEITEAAARKIVQGVGNNRFNPTAVVRASDSVAMFLRAMGKGADAEAPGVEGINQNAWYAAYFNAAVANELIDGSINPARPMTRIQAAALLANAKDVFELRPDKTAAQANALLVEFTDLQGLTAQERADLAVTVHHGIFQGHGGGRMGPYEELTRSQMASLAVRFQNLILGS